VQFPKETHAVEGEEVLFQVKATGSPQPKLTWYHNGEEVVADYSRELAEDGTLTLPSTEARHSGTYQLVAQNPAGRREREVRLFVEAVKQTTSMQEVQFSAVPVAMFGDHVRKSHSENNKGFRKEFQASACDKVFMLPWVPVLVCVSVLLNRCSMTEVKGQFS